MSEDHTGEHLDIYDTRDGWWNPDHGELEIPDGWDLLPRGDTFLTRRVKAAGSYWLVWSPRTRNRPHRTAIGLMAPKTTTYEQDLDDAGEGDLVGDDWLYREVKSTAHVAVDDFIDLHRRP